MGKEKFEIDATRITQLSSELSLFFSEKSIVAADAIVAMEILIASYCILAGMSFKDYVVDRMNLRKFIEANWKRLQVVKKENEK